MSNSTITFSRDCFNNYKTLRDNAVINKQNTFVTNGNLVSVQRADVLIKKMGWIFEHKEVTEATIPYPFY